MNKCWMVSFVYKYEGSEVVGLYNTEEKAEAKAKELTIDEQRHRPGYIQDRTDNEISIGPFTVIRIDKMSIQ